MVEIPSITRIIVEIKIFGLSFTAIGVQSQRY